MKFDPIHLDNASMNQLTTALIDAVGPLIDHTDQDVRDRTRLAFAIALQLDGRVRARSLPEE